MSLYRIVFRGVIFLFSNVDYTPEAHILYVDKGHHSKFQCNLMTNTIKFHGGTITEKETEDCKRQRQWMVTAKVFPGQNSVVSYMYELTIVVTE